MRFRLPIFFLFLLCPLLAAAQSAGTQLEKEVQIERYVVQALTKSFLGYHEEAIALYKQALDLSPTSSTVNSSIAEAYAKLEDHSSAVYYATQAKDFSPDNSFYHHQLAELYIALEEVALAEKILKEITVKFPDDIEALEQLAYLQFTTEQYDKALISYKAIEGRLGPQQQTSYRLLQIYFEMNDVGGMEQALINLEKQNPSNLAIKRNLAELYAQNNREDEAVQLLEMALAMDSSDVETIVPLAQLYEALDEKAKADALWQSTLQVSGSPEAAFSRASHLYTRTDDHNETLDVVVRLLEYAIEQDPSYAEAIVLLGTIRFEESKFDEAGKLLYEAVQLNPRSPDIWVQAAAAYLRINQPKRAADIADEALMLFPGQTSLLRVAAYGYMDAYQNDRSIKKFEEFYTLLKNDSAQHRELPEILAALGLLHARTKNYAASDSSYERALEMAPKNALVLNNLAYSLAERNKSLKKALDFANQAIKLDPGNPSYMDTIGWVYFKLDDLKKAEHWLKRAIEAGANSATTYEHLGDIQVRLGNHDAALVSWNKSLQINPENHLLLEKIKNNE